MDTTKERKNNPITIRRENYNDNALARGLTTLNHSKKRKLK